MAGKKSSADRDAVLADYASGMRVADIIAKHHVGSDTICRWAREAGIARGKRKSQRNDKGAAYALTGGHWIPDPQGIQRWVAD